MCGYLGGGAVTAGWVAESIVPCRNNLDELLTETRQVPDCARELVDWMTRADPGARPTWAEVKRHELFSTIQWTALERKTFRPPFRPAMHPVEPKESANSVQEELEGILRRGM